VSASRVDYAHVGIVSDIVVKGSPTVISSSKRCGRVVEGTWDQSAAGVPARRRGRLPGSLFIARARAQIGRRWFLFDNCEHVAARAHGLPPHSGQMLALGLLAVAARGISQ
jgi:hypothetical protein